MVFKIDRMKGASLGFKLIALTVGTILVVTLAFGGLVYINFREIFKKQLVDKGIQLADFLNKHSAVSYGIIAEEKFLLAEAINLFMRDNDVIFASALNDRGEVLAFRTKDETIVDDMVWFISGLVSEDSASDRRIIERKTAAGEEVVIFLYPVVSERKEELFGGTGEEAIRGYTVLVLTLRNFYKDFFRRIFGIGITIGIITIGVVAAIFYLIRNNVRPLVELKERTEKISKEGELREKVEVETGDEIQEIAESFSRMIEILKAEIHNTKVISKKLSDMAADMFRTMERINLSTAEQNSKIVEIESLADSIHNREFNTVVHIDSLIEAVESISQRINEINSSLSYLRKVGQALSQRLDEMLIGVLDVKRTTDEMGKTDSISVQLEDFSKALEGIRGTMSGVLEESRESSAFFDVVGEGIYQIVSEVDNISICISNIRNIKEELLNLMYSARREVEEITGIVFELLDFTDDTNMLAINASIIASQEKGQRGREFGVVAEEIKRLSQDTENKIKRIREKLRAIKRSMITAEEIVDRNIEEAMTDVSNTRESISAAVRKMRGILDEMRTRYSSVLTTMAKVVQDLSSMGERISSMKEISHKVVRALESARRLSEQAEPLVREVSGAIIRTSEEIQAMSDKVEKLGPTVLRLNDELIGIKEEARVQFLETENIKNKTRELGSIIYEMNKVIIFSLSRVKLIARLGARLEEITKRYKT